MRIPSLLLVLALAACSDAKPPEVPISEALPNIPIPPNASIVSREVGVDALKIRFHTSLTPAAAANYYRELLSRPPFDLVSDTRTEDKSYALYAEQTGKPSMWVTVLESPDKNGALVDVAGAKDQPKRAP